MRGCSILNVLAFSLAASTSGYAGISRWRLCLSEIFAPISSWVHDGFSLSLKSWVPEVFLFFPFLPKGVRGVTDRDHISIRNMCLWNGEKKRDHDRVLLPRTKETANLCSKSVMSSDSTNCHFLILTLGMWTCLCWCDIYTLKMWQTNPLPARPGQLRSYLILITLIGAWVTHCFALGHVQADLDLSVRDSFDNHDSKSSGGQVKS